MIISQAYTASTPLYQRWPQVPLTNLGFSNSRQIAPKAQNVGPTNPRTRYSLIKQYVIMSLGCHIRRICEGLKNNYCPMMALINKADHPHPHEHEHNGLLFDDETFSRLRQSSRSITALEKFES